MSIDDIRNGIKIYNALKSPDSFKSVLVDTHSTDREVSNDVALAISLGKDRDIRLTTTIFLTGSPNSLPNNQRLGVAFFTGFVTLIDRVLDKKDCPHFQTSDALTNYLLTRNVQIGARILSLGQLYDITLNHFPEGKQQQIAEFAREMINIQIQFGNHRKIGNYGFKEIQEYKERTNQAYGKTALSLAENKSKDMKKFPDATLAIQIFDDAWDFQTDASNEVENLLIGMTTDVWKSKGCPPNEDLGFITSELKKGTKIDPRKLIRSPEMKDTKEALQKEFDIQVAKLKGFRFNSVLAVEWNYVLGMKSII